MKISVFTVILVIMAIPVICFSATIIGNPPGFPEKNKFSFGVEYYDISNIEMEYDDNVQDDFTLTGRTFRASYGLSEILALDIRFGTADFENLYDEGTLWGVGARAIIHEWADGFRLMGGFQYNKYDLDDAERGGLKFWAEPNSSVASIDISKTFADRLTVYGGIDYAYMMFKYFHDGIYGDREGGYEQLDEFGFYGGADFRIVNGLSFFAEKHFTNEEAYVLGVLYKFMGDEPVTFEKAPAVPPDSAKFFDIKKFHISGEFSRFTDKKMVEEGGYVPQYDQYRMASDRMFAVISYDVIDRVTVFTKFGNADLETHSSEGETTLFDSEFAFGIGSRVKLIEVSKDIWINGEISYLSYSPENEETTASAKRATKTPGDVSIEWSEMIISGDISKRVGNTLLFAGVKYENVTADQDRVLDDESVISSSFEADQNVGIFAGFEYFLAESFSVYFRTDLITERQYTFGGSFSF